MRITPLIRQRARWWTQPFATITTAITLLIPRGEALYNSTILMYFLDYFTIHKEMPEYLTDLNLRADLSWVRRLTSANAGDTEAFVTQLTTENRIAHDKNFLTSKFNTVQFFQPGFYPGLLTQQDNFFLRLPNLNIRQIFIEYFNELHHIDVSTRYSELMQAFVNVIDFRS
jgi:hypothetical protein